MRGCRGVGDGGRFVWDGVDPCCLPNSHSWGRSHVTSICSVSRHSTQQQRPFLLVLAVSRGGRFNYKDVASRVFSGPRTIITLLTTATP
jgi:hypothetical protein